MASSRWEKNEMYAEPRQTDLSRYNKKTIDLSMTWRLATLPSGAQLELVQASRSPSIVDVALQLPQSENNVRLTDKFPSSTTFWQLLRRFESGVAGGAKNLNFTQRGVPEMNGSTTGAGRLNYETPVLHVQGRELGSLEDLQKTLAQIGVNNGRVLIRLSFRNSGIPLEEAMSKITQYFKDVDGEALADASVSTEVSATMPRSQPEVVEEATASGPATGRSEEVKAQDEMPTLSDQSRTQQGASGQAGDIEAGPDGRPLLIYSAPTTNSPQASRFETHDSDFEPTVDHAKLHQARLNTESRNRRLPSDREIEEAEKARKEKIAAVKEVRIRVRLPDQTSVESVFTREEPASKLYAWVRSMMELPDEPFTIRYLGGKGQQVALNDGPERLVADLGFAGRTLANFTWDEQASVKARQVPLLKELWRKQAQSMKVDTPVREIDMKQAPSGYENKPQPKKSSGTDKEQKLKNLLGFGKKK